MSEHLVHMAFMGLLVSAVPPALLVLIRRVSDVDVIGAPAWLAFPGFIATHFGLTWYQHHAGVVVAPAMLLGAMVFWAPVVGTRYRLPEAGRVIHLYAGMPLLDLAGVWLVAVGDQAGGLAMIVGMLPMGVVAVALTWSWISREEREQVGEEL